MTRDEIIRMAREVGLVSTYSRYDDWIDAGPSGEDLMAFAQLVEDAAFQRWAAQTKQAVDAEREACVERASVALLGTLQSTTDRVLKAIRARGQQ